MIIRSVYVDHSVTLQAARYVGYDISRAITRRADSVAATGVNVAWTTNLPDDPAIVAQYVRGFRAMGMEIVAGSGRWYAGARPAATQIATITALHASLPADARPWRWSLGDETTLTALADLQTIADACNAASIPTTMVQVPEYHRQTLATIGNRIPVVSVDCYPFFQPGLPSNPPYGADALMHFRTTCRDVVARSKVAGVTPLMMTQGFGGDVTFAMPTPAQTRWQIWTAIASGSPGVVVFAHGMPSPDGGPTAPPQSLVDWRRETETLASAGVAVRDAFARLATLDRMAGSTAEAAPAWQGTPAAGDMAVIRKTNDGKRVLIVVADPDQQRRTIKMTLPLVMKIAPIAASSGGSLSVLPWPWHILFPPTFSVSLIPGDAWIGSIN